MQTENTNRRKPSDSAIEFGKRLRQVMRLKKIEQIDLIKQTGLNKSMVSQWYRGRRKAGPKNNRILAEFLGCDCEWLSTGDDREWRYGEVSATISPGDQNKIDYLKSTNKMPTIIDPNLRIFVGWLNEYFEKYPEHSLRFLEDMKNLYPSLAEYSDRIGGPKKNWPNGLKKTAM